MGSVRDGLVWPGESRAAEAGGRLVAGWEPGFLRNPVPFPLIS